MTQKFIRWSCPHCGTQSVAPVLDGTQPGVLRCDSCQYVNDPLDETWPRPEGPAEEEAPDRRLPPARRSGTRQTPG